MGDGGVRALAARLQAARTLTEHRRAADILCASLDTSHFCRQLHARVAEGTDDGWTHMLKAVVIGLADREDQRRRSRAELVLPLQKLIEKAAGRRVHFPVGVVKKIISNTLDDELISDRFSHAAAIYWSILSSLCSCGDYFRRMGRDDAASLIGRLTSHSWNVLAPEPNNGDGPDPSREPGAAELRQTVFAAIRLLCAVLTYYPFALPETVLCETIEKFKGVVRMGNTELRSAMPQLWMSVNVMLRRQVIPLVCCPGTSGPQTHRNPPS